MSTSPADPARLDETGPDRQYQQALAQGEFRIQHCLACSRHVFYPRCVCNHCGSDRLQWVTPSGLGTVYSSTTVRRKPDEGGDTNIALIDLAEGVRLMSRVEGLPAAQVRIGMAVRARIGADAKGGPLVVFDVVDGRAASADVLANSRGAAA